MTGKIAASMATNGKTNIKANTSNNEKRRLNMNMNMNMNKNRNGISIFKKVLSATLVLLLCASMIPAAFAAGEPIYGKDGNPPEAAATKMLVMPIGTNTPAASFTFKFKKDSYDGGSDAADLAKMPDLLDQTVTYTIADVGKTVNGIKYVPKETPSLFKNTSWLHAGVYSYLVSETKDTYAIADPFVEKMEYSKGVYKLTAYVRDGTSGPELYAIAATIVVNDDSNKTSAEGDKVDVSLGGDPNVTGDYSKMIFTNSYLKNNGGIDPAADSVLAISNAVTDGYGDKTKFFEFKVTVSNPETVTDITKTYKAYVMNANDDVITSTDNVSAGYIKSSTKGDYIEFKTGTELTVNLKHGQRLSFTDMPVGSSFAVTESAALSYTPSYILTLNGNTGTAVNGEPSKPLSIAKQYIGEEANAAAFTNMFKNIIITGVSVDDLPYIVLIGAALLTLAGFITINIRKHRASQS